MARLFCETCDWFAVNECHRHPPTVRDDCHEWPTVARDDFCGEHSGIARHDCCLDRPVPLGGGISIGRARIPSSGTADATMIPLKMPGSV